MALPLRKPMPNPGPPGRSFPRRQAPRRDHPARPAPKPQPLKFVPLGKPQDFGKRGPLEFGSPLKSKGLRILLRRNPYLQIARTIWDHLPDEDRDPLRAYYPKYARAPVGFIKVDPCAGLEDHGYVFPYGLCTSSEWPGNQVKGPPYPDHIGGYNRNFPNYVGWEPLYRFRHSSTWKRVDGERQFVPHFTMAMPQSQLNPSPALAPVPWFLQPYVRNIPGIREHVSPGAGPKNAPSLEVSARGVRTVANTHVRAPRANERKITPVSQSALKIIQGIFHTVTEADDFVDAFWKTLPGNLKWVPGKPQNIADKLGTLMKHWDKVDLNQAIFNLGYNHVEDAIIGGAFDKLQKAGNKLGVHGSGFKFYHPTGL